MLYKKDKEPLNRKELVPSPCQVPRERWGWSCLLSVHCEWDALTALQALKEIYPAAGGVGVFQLA